MKMKNKIIKIFFCNLKFLFFYKMSLEQKIKNECLKTYNDIVEKIKLLSSLIDTNDISKIKYLSSEIELKANEINYLLSDYEKIKYRLERIKEINEKI